MNYKSYHLFEVISNKTRWKIISTLYKSEKCVKEICKDIKEEQSKVSHNLKILSNCKIVFYKREGKYKTYSLNKKTIIPIIEITEKHIDNFCKKEGCKFKKD
ncbi:MAG: metalloregulator ArsR/SmtB family transcription factor [Candidatus ainarchaeum sp.]|nr:metalloregulator ArsR/SmtB family transcription factor [Candidatus ainarchaeum sp.]MDD3975678.1 metalloregulator ArsR/SmtB family transcription factor [Candidatus ainarchaeum sp.]